MKICKTYKKIAVLLLIVLVIVLTVFCKILWDKNNQMKAGFLSDSLTKLGSDVIASQNGIDSIILRRDTEKLQLGVAFYALTDSARRASNLHTYAAKTIHAAAWHTISHHLEMASTVIVQISADNQITDTEIVDLKNIKDFLDVLMDTLRDRENRLNQGYVEEQALKRAEHAALAYNQMFANRSN